MGGVLGLVMFVLAIVGTVEVVKSSRDTTKKILWILAVWFTGGIGTIVYFVLKATSKK